MPDENKPITDKDNFPPVSEDEKRYIIHLIVPSEEAAYLDGCSDGYRRAVSDFMLWSLAFFVVAILARNLAKE